MTALLSLVCLAGAVAAVVLFRWARLLAMAAVVATGLYFAHGFWVWQQAHGQEGGLVHCTIGWSSTWTTHARCNAMVAAAQELTTDGPALTKLHACAAVLAEKGREVHVGDYLNLCADMARNLSPRQ